MALNFLVMGVKALAKKVGKGALKKKAKDFVKGIKDMKKDKNLLIFQSFNCSYNYQYCTQILFLPFKFILSRLV